MYIADSISGMEIFIILYINNLLFSKYYFQVKTIRMLIVSELSPVI